MGELTLPPLQLTVPVRRGQILLPHFWTTPLHAETLHLLYSFIHDHTSGMGLYKCPRTSDPWITIQLSISSSCNRLTDIYTGSLLPPPNEEGHVFAPARLSVCLLSWVVDELR